MSASSKRHYSARATPCWGGERRGGKRDGAATDTFCSGGYEQLDTLIASRIDGRFWFQTKEIVLSCAPPGAEVWSSPDGLKCFRAVERATCKPSGLHLAAFELLDHAAFRWVNTMLGNIKNSFTGAAISSQRHIPAISLNTASASTIALTLAACSCGAAAAIHAAYAIPLAEAGWKIMGNQVEECFFAVLVKIGFMGTAFVRMAKV